MSTYIKIENTWTPINKIFKKINGEWVLQNDIISALGDMIYVYGGNTISKLLYIIFNQQQYTGKSFLLTSTYDGNTVYPSWTIVSGSQYVTINSNGKVTINEGVTNQSIEIQASYNGETDNKTITVSYDNQLTIESADTITGTSGNVIARYNSTVVTPTWSITSGNQYATINSSGEITIISSGTITVSASYNNYSATKNITLVYDSSTSTEVEVNDDGSITTTVNIVTENQDGTTTETSVITTTNEDGSTSNTESETTINQDGSSSTTSTTTNSDGTSSETTGTTSAPDPTTGSTTSTSTTINYDENGNSTGSSDNTTVNNTDGSSSSTTTNYNSAGDPTSQVNNDIDTSGNSNTQNIEYDSNGDPVVTGYSIDTSNNTTTGSESLGGNSGVNTHFIPFDGTNGFELIIKFRTVKTEQPKPPTVTDTEDNSNNYHFNILGGKSAAKVGGKWPGIDIRWTLAKNNYSSGDLLTRYQPASGNQTSIKITNNHKSNVYYLKYVYDPSLETKKMKIYNLWNSSTTTIGSSNDALGSQNLEITIGYALNMQGDPYRYANVDILEFNVTKLSS